ATHRSQPRWNAFTMAVECRSQRDIVIARDEAIQAQAMPGPPPGLHRLCYTACAWIASLRSQ
ncbi:MAG: hypothetical protein LBJ47_05280, partial [Tannerella sp.]|nr:hypothetical protein [Tannerella sp.]